MVYENLVKSFNVMEKQRSIDLSILSQLNKVKSILADEQRKFIDNKDTIKANFIRYHSLEVQKSILNQITFRVENYKEADDNPKVAEDSLRILPLLEVLYIATKKRDFIPLDMLLLKSEDIQKNAIDLNLYPSTQSVLRDINRKQLKEEVGELQKRISQY